MSQVYGKMLSLSRHAYKCIESKLDWMNIINSNQNATWFTYKDGKQKYSQALPNSWRHARYYVGWLWEIGKVVFRVILSDQNNYPVLINAPRVQDDTIHNEAIMNRYVVAWYCRHYALSILFASCRSGQLSNCHMSNWDREYILLMTKGEQLTSMRWA